MSKLKELTKTASQAWFETKVKIKRRAGLLDGGDWKSGLPIEMTFWEWALKDNGKNWDQGEWRNCTNPDLELQQELKDLIPAPPGAIVRILDVGSGPLTRVGKKWSGREVQISPVDPLGDQYNALMARLSLKPLVAPIQGDGEKLLDLFQPDTFDLGYASNSLDHSYDPIAAIQQMLAVVKPGHFVYLWHATNEGVKAHYSGLHQWNFNVRKDEFVLSDGKHTQSVTEACKGLAEVTCELGTAFDTEIVITRMKKVASA